MPRPRDLHELAREHAGERVLSVYLDARVTDPAMRHTWRAALVTALRAARAEITDPRERADFDRAASFLDDPLPPIDGTWGAPGWVAFLAPDGPLYAAELPVRVPTIAVWRDGPIVSPYVRVLKQHRPVIVALVDSRSARLFRYAWGELTALPELTIEVAEERAPAPTAPEPRAMSAPAPRGALGTERAHRRRRAHFQRLATSLSARLAELAGEDGWVLVGGSSEWARVAAEALPAALAERTLVSATLDGDAAESTIALAAKEAATELRAERGRALLERLRERAGGGGRGVVGVAATQRALHAQAMELLLVTPELLRAEVRLAEDAVRAALAQGAEVEVLSGGAAEELDRAGGLAGRLRYAIDAPVPREGAARAAGAAPGAGLAARAV
ncbi:MAG TPA: hypothetical protein VFS05_15170 [Gemmatimonadaceae bacterium]|nr:hypothetical protein [Gemmatimonadaceae bacterium]